jgi:ribosomal protein L11 methyltransferase
MTLDDTPTSDRWVEVTLRVPSTDSEAIADGLRDAGALGVAIEPAIRISDSADFEYEELHDEDWTVRGSFREPLTGADRRAIRGRLQRLELSRTLTRLRYREVSPADWAEEWKRFFKPLHVGRRLVVRPSWEPYTPAPGEVVIDLDPGTAFGTGQHETTRLCLAALERHVRRGAEVIDVGCGSGILAIAAARLGAAGVRAVDLDVDAIEVARTNALRNGVALKVIVARGSLGADWPWRAQPSHHAADVIVANISSTVDVALMPLLREALRPRGVLIASGFIARDADEVCAAAAACGLTKIRLEREGDWCCLEAEWAAAY